MLGLILAGIMSTIFLGLLAFGWVEAGVPRSKDALIPCVLCHVLVVAVLVLIWGGYFLMRGKL